MRLTHVISFLKGSIANETDIIEKTALNKPFLSNCYTVHFQLKRLVFTASERPKL